MERLTERHENGSAMIKGCGANCKYGFAHCRKEDWENCKTIDDVIDKLADYEDAEEQGLLLRLPCKVGDVVAIVLFLPSTGKRYIEQAEVKEINIGKYNLREDIQLKVEPISKRGVIYKYYLSEWGDNIFSTLTEAEKALADMGV